MTWFRIDDGFHSHPKVLATSLAARGLWATAGSWSSGHLTDGFVPTHVLVSLGDDGTLADELVTAGLWRRRKGGVVFHDWKHRNPTRADVEKDRADARMRMKNLRKARSDPLMFARTSGEVRDPRPVPSNTGFLNGNRPGHSPSRTPDIDRAERLAAASPQPPSFADVMAEQRRIAKESRHEN